MKNVRSQIDRDYNGSYDTMEEILQALEYPVGDLFDDDTYWQEDDEETED